VCGAVKNLVAEQKDQDRLRLKPHWTFMATPQTTTC